MNQLKISLFMDYVIRDFDRNQNQMKNKIEVDDGFCRLLQGNCLFLK